MTRYEEFQRWFGGVFGDDKLLPCTANGVFENVGIRVWGARTLS